MYANDEIPHDPTHFLDVFGEAQAAITAYFAGERGRVDAILEDSRCDLCLGQALVGIIVRTAAESKVRTSAERAVKEELEDMFGDDLTYHLR